MKNKDLEFDYSSQHSHVMLGRGINYKNIKQDRSCRIRKIVKISKSIELILTRCKGVKKRKFQFKVDLMVLINIGV